MRASAARTTSFGPASRGGKITAAALRDRIGTGRKPAIRILDLFDRTGITTREDDLRRFRGDRLEILKGRK
jgi:hypothetical protein